MSRTKKTVREVLDEIQMILTYSYYDSIKFMLIAELINDNSEDKKKPADNQEVGSK